MAKQKQITDDSIWSDRIKSAIKYRQLHDTLFHCDMLEDYYEGRQYEGDNPFANYSINKFYETVQIKLDQFVPEYPGFDVSATPGSSDYNLENAALSSQLKSDVLNSLTQNPEVEFPNELRLAYKDHFFRFSILEVGYAADWVNNPNASKPLLVRDTDRMHYDNSNQPKLFKGKDYQPRELPANERIYFKHIEAKKFYVGGNDARYLNRCGWYGYYEYVSKEDILAMPDLMNRDLIESSTPNYNGEGVSTQEDEKAGTEFGTNDSFKLWHIWDNKAGVRLLIIDEPCVTIFQRKFKYQTIFDYRADQRISKESFYPIPPAFHWVSPQNEINEVRTQLRNHRRRFNRKFGLLPDGMDDTEIQKFESGDDGTIVKFKRPGALTAIEDPSLGVALNQSLITSDDDLNQISGTSSAVRGRADRTTATEAGIINTKAEIRENAERDRISSWISKIGRCILLCARDNFALGTWATLTQDPGEDLFTTVSENKAALQWVSSEQLNDGYDFKIRVDVTTLSAATREIEEQKYIKFLTLLTNYPSIALSPTLIRETAYRVGYRNEKVIKEMQKMAMIQQAGVMSQIPGMQTNSNLPQQTGAKMAGPQVEQIQNQLQGQVLQ